MKKKKKGVISFSDYQNVENNDNSNQKSEDIAATEYELNNDNSYENDSDANTVPTENIEKPSTRSRKVRRAFVKSKKYGRLLLRLLLVFIIVAVVLIIYVNRDNISAQSISDWLVGIVTGQERETSYPITASGAKIIDFDSMDKSIAVLTDTSIVSYDKYGKELISRQHKMGNPIMRLGDNTILLYELGGQSLSVESRSDVKEHETEYKLLSADINDKGVYAYATRSEGGYMSELHVYNEHDQEIYKGYQSKYLISDIAISEDSDNVATLMMGAIDGGYYCGIKIYDLSNNEPLQADITETLLLDIAWCGENIVAVGTDCTIILDSIGEEIERFTYDNQLVSYSFNKDNVCLIFEDSLKGEYSASILDENGQLVGETDIPSEMQAVSLSDNRMYVLTSSELYCYDFTGELKNEWLTQGNSQRLAVMNGNSYVVSGLQIQSINTK